MTPDLPKNPRDELEAKLTALLLGELPSEEAFALGRTIEQDPELAKLHQRLAQTIKLVRETEAAPADQTASTQPAPKLSSKRREALLQQFKTVKPKEFAGTQKHQQWWQQPRAIAAMVALLAIASFVATGLLVTTSELKSVSTINRADTLGSEAAIREEMKLAEADQARDAKMGGLLQTKSQPTPAPPPPTHTTPAQIVLPTGNEVAQQQNAPTLSNSQVQQEKTLALNDGSRRSPGAAGSQISLANSFASSSEPKAAAAPMAEPPAKTARPASPGFRFWGPSETSTLPDANGREGDKSVTTTFSVGDPEFVGVLENGKPGHSTSNKFISSYEYALTPEFTNYFDLNRNGEASTATGLPTAQSNRQGGTAYYLGNVLLNAGTATQSGSSAAVGPSATGQVEDLSFRSPQFDPATGLPLPTPGFSGQVSASPQTQTRSYDVDAADLRKALESSKTVTAGGEIIFGLSPEVASAPRPSAAPANRPFGGQGGGGAGGGGIQGVTRTNGAEVQQNRVSQLLADAGVKLNPSKGESAYYNERTGKLIVQGTEENLNKVQAVTNFGQFAFDDHQAIPLKFAHSSEIGDELAQITRETPDSTKKHSKVPLLADIPVEGRLFRSDTNALGLAPQLQAGHPLAVDAETRSVSVSTNAVSAIDSMLAFKDRVPLINREKATNSTYIQDGKLLYDATALNDAIRRRLTLAGEPTNTYDRYTLYRNLAQLGTDSSSDAGEIHLNYQTSNEGLTEKSKEASKTRKTAAASSPSNVYELNIVGYANVQLPKTITVQVIDAAQPATNSSSTLWDRMRGKPAKFESKARIKLERNNSDIVYNDATKGASGYDPYFVQTEFETIESERVLGKVVKDLNLDQRWSKVPGRGEKLSSNEAIAKLKNMLDLRPVKNTSDIEIGAKSEKAGEAAEIANAVVRAYKDFRHEQLRLLTVGGISALKEQITAQEQKIANAQAEVDRLAPKPVAHEEDKPLARPAAPAPIPQPEVLASENPFSTFSLNVSDVSFKLAGASLEKGVLPETASIRSEEFINAFDYRDPEPSAGVPVAFASERARYPFAQNRDLLRFSIKTTAFGREAGRPLNIVVLLDNSGSMERADRVRIIHEALRVLAAQLKPQDKLSVVTFSRTARLVADGVAGDQAAQVAEQVSGLTPEGGTNLEEAMNLAYQTALHHYLANGINRVVLLTDGAANLGDVQPESLKQKVEANRKQGIALDCFGIGWEGYNDDLLEVLSRNGDGRYGFINSPEEAASEFAGQLAGALHVAASDVKVQVEFNSKRVQAYRQIGYAKHQLTKEQFRDNTVDAAEIGAAESGNALYVIEVNPQGEGPLATVRCRYKVPGTSDYREQEWTVPYTSNAVALDQSTPAMRLAATACAFSEWLATSPFAAEVTPDRLLSYLSGVPEIYGADARPKKLEWMIQQAKSLEGK